MLPVIICGGQGTRLWPVSRASYPKPFCELLDESLLTKTVKRLVRYSQPWVVTVKELKVLTERVFRENDLKESHVVTEPFGRNTAPAIALLCRVLEQKGRSNEVVGVFPADHLVQKTDAFWKALDLAQECANKGQVATLGLKPSYPATGYGYIEIGSESFGTLDGLSANRTVGFHEKPNAERAKAFVDSGKFFWNAGIFVFKVETMISHFKKLKPEMWTLFTKLKDDLSNVEEIYRAVESISIDYAIMEKLKEQVCVPCDIGWNDIGSWDELAEVAAKPPSIFEEDAGNNFVYPADKEKVYAFVGVDDLVVADTRDAVLVTKKGRGQKVKDVLARIEKAGYKAAKEHVFEYRPWGKFEILRDTEYFKSKVIRVDPGQKISYQSHAKRAEHWVVVKGRAQVVLNDKVIEVGEGEHVFIPKGAKHRIQNPGRTPVEFVEVQVGTYFGEDDIVRYNDDYGRS